MSQAPKLLKLIIRPATGVVDNSRVPTTLRQLPEMNLPVARTRNWHFDRVNGMWTVNEKLFDENRCDALCKHGTAEIWNFSTAGGWAHPVHNHVEEPRNLSLNGKSVEGTTLQGRKDAHPLYPGDEISVYIKFRDWIGRYPMHCHNLIHEDHAMMFRWDMEA
jgi:FtsP/CotA-like multicopper oxidase with cupredoxin domain